MYHIFIIFIKSFNIYDYYYNPDATVVQYNKVKKM